MRRQRPAVRAREGQPDQLLPGLLPPAPQRAPAALLSNPSGQIVRKNGAKNADIYRASSSLTKVSCKCPRCGRMHDVRMTPVRPGFTPRIYCNRCETAVAHMAEHRDLAYESGHAVGYY